MRVILLFLILSITLTLFTQEGNTQFQGHNISIWADGYDWCLHFNDYQRILLVSSILEYLETDKDIWTTDIIVLSLDYIYNGLMERSEAQGLPEKIYLEIKPLNLVEKIINGTMYAHMTRNLDPIIEEICATGGW